MTKQIISKIDAACRQLDSSITLYFNDGDPIAVHTLSCAAHQIIHDLNRHRKGPELLFDNLIFKDETRGLAKKYLHKHYNFFKHADSDPNPNGTIEFDPEGTEIFILGSIKGTVHFGIPMNIYRSAFLAYFAYHNANLLTQQGLEFYFDKVPLEMVIVFRFCDRTKFLDLFLKANR